MTEKASSLKPLLWMAAGWLAVLVASRWIVGAADLAYESSGSGCRELTAAASNNLHQAAAVSGAALLTWIAAGAWLLSAPWKRALGTASGADVSLVLLAFVLGLGGILGFLADELGQIVLVAVTLLLCGAIGAGLALYGFLGANRSKRSASEVATPALATIVWILAALAVPVFAGGSGEILTC